MFYTLSKRNINPEPNHTVMKPQVRLLHLLFVIGLAAVRIAAAEATTASFNVQPGQEVARPVNLNKDDRCSVTLTIQGSGPTKLHFFMVLPNGTTADYGEVTQCRVDFFTDVTGECQFHFDNTNSQDTQLVTLNYEIEHFVFGMPNMIFMLVVITVLLVFVAAGYALMGKYR